MRSPWHRLLGLAGFAVGLAPVLTSSCLAQSDMSIPSGGRTNQVTIRYEPPANQALQELYDLLRERQVLEKIQEIIGPFRSPEQLTVKTAQCGEINSWYRREDGRPTVTICYEYLQHILDSLPAATSDDGITRPDAAIGQFFAVTLHEIGHATFDILNVPIFGHVEDAADNFATYIMLQFGKGQARRLIEGASWAWRSYLGDYKRNPVVPTRLNAFAADHGLPQERFYNLLCLAYGADPVQFADAANYLPATRAPNCVFEYRTLVRAFRQEISPHIDQDMAKRVLDADWLPN